MTDHSAFTEALRLVRLMCLSSERAERLAAADMQGVHRVEAELRRVRHEILAGRT